MNNYRLSDLLDLTSIQKMADAHFRLAAMPIGIIDAVDGSILVASGWQDVCVKFHRANPLSLQRCHESDNYINGHLISKGACRYKCRNGLWHAGMPIVISGRHLATMFLGQFFYEGDTHDREFFIRQAHECGFDLDDYLAALERVPVFSHEKIDYILEYNKALVGFITDLAGHSFSKIKTGKILRENERKFHAIFDQTYQFVGLLSKDGTLLEANKTALEFSGVKAADVIGKPFWQTSWWAHSPELQKQVHLAVQKAATGEFVRFEGTHYAADGDLHYIDFSLKPITDDAGNVVLLIPEGRDITERKRGEETLLKNDKLLRRAEEVAKLGSWEFLMDENRVYGSEGARAIYGLNPGEWSISDVQRIPLPEYRAMLDKALRDLIEHGIPYNVEFKIRRPTDGEIVDIHAIAEYDATKKVVFGVIQDITERMRAEKEKGALHAQLMQAQKMESVGRLAGGVAHDFNNMLTTIIGHADLAMRRSKPERIHDDLQAIRRSALRSAELIRQLLAFARRQTVTPKVIDLNERVNGMLEMLHRLIGEDIALGWTPGADLWQIKIDPSQIDQLLANLCVNARDAIPGVGRVTIETRNIASNEEYCVADSCFISGEYVMLAVSDNGAGMSKDVLDHLFEPFFTTKEVGKGTGLGLATVYGIVKQNEGFINVCSVPGNGSTFKIYLPRHTGEALETMDTDSVVIPISRGETVLLVEDEATILNVGREMLETLGYVVLTAAAPAEALQQARIHGADIQLLIIDVVMPEMNGRDLAKLINDINPGLKCLFTSGYTADIIAHRGVLDKGVYFLEKPFSMKDLAIKVQEILGHV